MRKDMREGIEVAASIEGFEAAQAFVEDLLGSSSVSREIAHATTLVFDTVFDVLLMQDIDCDTPIRVSAEDRLNGTFIITSYLGSYDIISLAICLEVFLGSAQNLLNVISDIVVAVEEKGVLREE